MPAVMDVNADVGEGFPHDHALLTFVTSANVACGFHAGDSDTMRRLCELSNARGVAVGAQVSYRDRAGFGRRDLEVAPDDLAADVAEQIDRLASAAAGTGATVAYVKPHGALYNRAVWDEVQARAVLDGSQGLAVLGLPGSVLLEAAERAGRTVGREWFADRGYTAEGRLVPRGEPGALVSDPAAIADRVRVLVADGTVTAVDGSTVAVSADSICVHGDAPGCVDAAAAVCASLARLGVERRSWR